MAALIALAGVLTLFLILLIRRGTKLSPRDVLSNYLNWLIGGRTQDAYHCLSSRTRADCPLAEFRARHAAGSSLVAGLLARGISFAVEKIEITGNRADASVTVTAPDFKLILAVVFQGIGPDRIPEKNLDALAFLRRKISHYLDQYPREAIPMKTCTESYHLIRERDGWKVSLDDGNADAA